jgi:hypothetical protein
VTPENEIVLPSGDDSGFTSNLLPWRFRRRRSVRAAGW